MYSVGVYSLGSSVASRFIWLVLVFCVIRCCQTYTCRNVVAGFSFLFIITIFGRIIYNVNYNLRFNERVFGFCVSPGKSVRVPGKGAQYLYSRGIFVLVPRGEARVPLSTQGYLCESYKEEFGV